jgi:cysteinyl-tRNA synthetase
MKCAFALSRRQARAYPSMSLLVSMALCFVGGCGSPMTTAPSSGNSPDPVTPPVVNAPPTQDSSGRGIPVAAPWVSFYGSAAQMGDLNKVANTFHVINIDADPDATNFTPAQITQLKAGGRNRVISYFNLGACETYRSYWKQAPAGFVAGRDNVAAHRGAYTGYADETWMDVGNADYQHLIVDYVAPRLVSQGIDGFFFDNLEIIEHGPNDKNGACDAACRQGGLDLVRKLREKFPTLLFVMQNATSDVTRLGQTGGKAFPTLLDGISHEEVYAPNPDAEFESQLVAWKGLQLTPGGKPFWIATEDYVGDCVNTAVAGAVYKKSRSHGFSPYATDASAKQQQVCYWPF